MGEAKRREMAGVMPGQQQITVDLKDAKAKVCECGCELFRQVFRTFIISPLVAPTGKEMLIQKAALICLDCGKELKFP